MGNEQKWQEKLDTWGEKVFRGRFLQQFSALCYKNSKRIMYGTNPCSFVRVIVGAQHLPLEVPHASYSRERLP